MFYPEMLFIDMYKEAEVFFFVTLTDLVLNKLGASGQSIKCTTVMTVSLMQWFYQWRMKPNPYTFSLIKLIKSHFI